MDMLYDAASKDEASKVEVYKILSESANYLEDWIIVKFVEKLDKIPSNLYQARDIDLVYSFARNMYKGTDAKESAIFFLYQIAVNLKEGVPVALLKPARKNLTELLKNQSHELKEDYICRCIDRISDDKITSIQSIKILINLIKSMPKYSYTKSDKNLQQKEFMKELVQHQNLIMSLINDLKNYKLRVVAYLTDLKAECAKNKVAFNPEAELADAELFEEGYTHAQNIQARLKAILFTLETCEGSQ